MLGRFIVDVYSRSARDRIYRYLLYVIKYRTRVRKVYFNKNNNNVCAEKRTHLRFDSRKYSEKQWIKNQKEIVLASGGFVLQRADAERFFSRSAKLSVRQDSFNS